MLKKFKNYKIYFSDDYKNFDPKEILNILHHPQQKNSNILGGRGSIKVGDLKDIGPVVIKEFFRGGFFGNINKNYFLVSKRIRPQIEYEFILKAKNLGINVPEPIGYFSRGTIFYRGWLIMKMINIKSNFADLSMKENQFTRELMPKLIEYFEKLIENRIFHSDLHPGNVLVDKDNKLFLIDFDKASYFKGNRNKLRDTYLFRWRRAVLKHKLPDYLSEYVCAGLRKQFSNE